MYFSKLTMSGFGPHVKTQSYEFNNGVTFITGKNGSGKTTIFDAIQWVLFGPTGSSRTLKNRSSIINSTRQSAKVAVEFFHDKNGKMKIVRSLATSGKHSLDIYQEVDDDLEKIPGGIREKQEYIESLFGNLRHDVFSSIYMLQSSPLGPPSSFIGATTTKRRETLAKIADPLDAYTKLHKEAKSDLRDAKKVLTSAQAKVSSLQEVYDDMEIPELPEISSAELADKLHQLEASQPKTSNEITRLERELERLESQLDDLFEESDNLFDRYDQAGKALKDNKAKKHKLEEDISSAEEEKSKYAALVEIYVFKLTEINRQIDIARMIKSDAYDRLNLVEAQKSLVDKSDDDGRCVLCGSDLDDGHHLDFDQECHQVLEEYNQLDRQHDKLKEQRLEITQGYESVKDKLDGIDLDRLQDLLESVEDRLEELRHTRKQIKTSIDNNNKAIQRVETQRDDIALSLEDHQEDEDKADAGIDLDRLYRAKVNAQAREEKVEQAKRDKEKQKEKISQAQLKEKQAKEEVERLEKEKHRTSPNGDISDKIAEIMESISSQASDLYLELFNTDFEIIITDGEDEEEKTCVMEVDGRDVATYSHGEQLRIYGCIQAGFTLTVYELTGIWVPMMWDEPSLATDQEVVSAIFSIPEKITPEFHQSFVITRDASVDTGDNEVIGL